MVEKWQLLKEEPYELDFRKLNRRIFQLPNGEAHNYDILIDREVSVIVAITPDDQFILVQQFRPGPNKVLLELPAGIIDAGEEPLHAAKRELLEESGYAGELTYVGPAYRDAYSTVVLHTFVAKNCQKMAEPKPEEDEFIEVVLLNAQEFRAHIKSGQLTDVGPAYLALDYLNKL